MTQPTPRPWEAIGQTVTSPAACGVGVAWCGENSISGTDDHYEISLAEAEANAELIARMARSHDALVAACVALVRFVGGPVEPGPAQYGTDAFAPLLVAADLARAALALANPATK